MNEYVRTGRTGYLIFLMLALCVPAVAQRASGLGGNFSDPTGAAITKAIVEPTVTRTIGIVERRGGSLSPAASRFRDLLFRKWRNVASGSGAP